jgi:hypothetical protein
VAVAVLAVVSGKQNWSKVSGKQNWSKVSGKQNWSRVSGKQNWSRVSGKQNEVKHKESNIVVMYQEGKIEVDYLINRNLDVPLNPTSLIIVIPASVTVQISRLNFLVLFTDWMKLKCRFFYRPINSQSIMQNCLMENKLNSK